MDVTALAVDLTSRRQGGARGRSGVAAGIAVLVLAATASVVPPSAGAEKRSDEVQCEGEQVLLVHDLAGTARDWDRLADDLREDGWCPEAVEWGLPRPGDHQFPVGGLSGVEPAAEELAGDQGWTAPEGSPRSPVAVVARGVGALVVQRAVQLAGDRNTPPISALVTLGPVWNGTNLLGIADIEDLSRRLGTFDAVLAWERTWLDQICEGCREVVRGSDLLVRMHEGGVRTPGVVYTDIITLTDVLVHPPDTQSPPGTRVRIVQHQAPGALVWHGDLGHDLGSRALVREALDPG